MSTNGETYDIDGIDTAGEGGTEPPATEPAPAQSPAPGVKVDLAVWARGEREYPFSEVVKAIDDYVFEQVWKMVEQRFVSVKTRGDALQFIIDEGLISSVEARGDV